jgi:hypothetical protein
MKRTMMFFMALLTLAAAGCAPTFIYVKASDNVRFADNTVIVWTVVDMPQDINDTRAANTLAIAEATAKVDAEMIVVIRKIAEEGGASFNEELVTNYVTEHAKSGSAKDLKKNTWRLEKRIKINGEFEGVNELLGVEEIREKPKEKGK